METQRILIDTSLIIDFFRKKNKAKAPLTHLFRQNYDLYISTLTIYELLCGAKSPQLQKDTEELLNLFQALDFGPKEAEKAALLYKQLKRQNQLIETIDLLISATALTYSLEIATLNKEHFLRIKDVNLFEF